MKKFSVQADLIRVVAILGALFIHLTYPIYARPDFFGGLTWWLTASISSFSRISIPLFIILSGYLLIPKQESWEQTKSRLLHRLLIPLGFWFSFYLIWNHWYFHEKLSVTTILSLLYQSNTYHLYFLLILAGLYFLLPLWRMLSSKLEPSYLKIVFIVSLIAGFLMYFVPYGLIRDQAQFNIFTAWVPYLGYFLFGGWLATKKPTPPKWLPMAVLASFLTTLGLSAFVVSHRMTSAAWLWRGHGVAFVDEYLSPQIILFALSFFWLCISMPVGKGFEQLRLDKLLRQLSRASFGAYLLHVLVLNILDHTFGFALETFPGGLLPYFVVRSALCLIFSFGISWLMLQLPWVKKLLGS